jgi:hypothetical protein
MEGGDGARSGGGRHTPPEKVRGSVFKVGSRCYATLLRAQRLTGAAAAYGGAASRVVRAVQPERVSGGRHAAGTDVHGTPECGSPREGATPALGRRARAREPRYGDTARQGRRATSRRGAGVGQPVPCSRILL